MGKMIVYTPCSLCGTKSPEVEILASEWYEYIDGALVQNVFPDLTTEQREVIISQRTGIYICDACWGSEDDTE